jgi:hypothetical protein
VLGKEGPNLNEQIRSYNGDLIQLVLLTSPPNNYSVSSASVTATKDSVGSVSSTRLFLAFSGTSDCFIISPNERNKIIKSAFNAEQQVCSAR